ncbi:hypothetical protein V8G54_037514 [Vigna mungo]|uniref:Uncharacterized protein n=1 Tax=Vigna mungo TaxID=3915 RepID=A0AAQ3MJD8_VIGMU
MRIRELKEEEIFKLFMVSIPKRSGGNFLIYPSRFSCSVHPSYTIPPVSPGSLRCIRSQSLGSVGINQQFMAFTHVTMESDKYICIRETAPQNSVVNIDTSTPMQPLRRPITADSALMNHSSYSCSERRKSVNDLELDMIELWRPPQQEDAVAASRDVELSLGRLYVIGQLKLDLELGRLRHGPTWLGQAWANLN